MSSVLLTLAVVSFLYHTMANLNQKRTSIVQHAGSYGGLHGFKEGGKKEPLVLFQVSCSQKSLSAEDIFYGTSEQ